jgi:hypothetical protein
MRVSPWRDVEVEKRLILIGLPFAFPLSEFIAIHDHREG